MKSRTEISYYRTGAAVAAPVRFAFASDIHDSPHEEILAELEALRADAVLIGGDFSRNRDDGHEVFPAACASVFPTFVTLGNHDIENSVDPGRIASSGAVLLDNASTRFRGVAIGGLSSAEEPDIRFLEEFSREEGFRLLICHHPEYYDRYIKKTSVDLTVSGHAHGGQWRLFGRGVFAPGQGLLPKYTSGAYDGGRLIVGRGLGDSHPVIPRINDPFEIVVIDVFPA